MGYTSRLPILVLAIFVLEVFLVLGQTPTTPAPTTAKPSADPCGDVNVNYSVVNTSELKYEFCEKCVTTTYNITDKIKLNCVFFETSTVDTHFLCGTPDKAGELTNNSTSDLNGCHSKYDPTVTTTTPAPTTSTTTLKPTTTVPSNASTSTTTTKGTTPTPTPSTTPKPLTSTAAPSNVTTATPDTPHSGGSFSFANFLGGMVFTLAVSSLAYVAWRFYKARTERNYHTF